MQRQVYTRVHNVHKATFTPPFLELKCLFLTHIGELYITLSALEKKRRIWIKKEKKEMKKKNDLSDKKGRKSNYFLWLPMTEQSSRRLVVSPSPESRGLSFHEGGRGIRSPMGRWNLRRRGSTVTTGPKFAWLPSSLATSSSGTGWAWGRKGGQDGERRTTHGHGLDNSQVWTERRATIHGGGEMGIIQ